MTPEEEAHWRYQLELMTNFGHRYNKNQNPWIAIPDQVAWLCEEARYKCHLANAYNKRQQKFVTPMMNELP